MSDQEVLEKHDPWLESDGPVAVVLREPLEPVEGADGVVFPPTFAPPARGEPPYYVVDELSDKSKVALLDTVGAQANRIEPVFKQYSGLNATHRLVPDAVIKVGEREVNLLDAGHRAADALVRFSSKKSELTGAFRDIAERGDASKLAKLAPTSLLFGVWDSRDSSVKLPRLIASTVRAFAVEPLTRAAQFFSAFEKDETESLGQSQEFLSEQGLSDAPAGRGIGGVLARGGIRRDTILNLVALRSLSAGSPNATRTLQRYVLGLALVALTKPADLFLRQGCLLVRTQAQKTSQEVVERSGKKEPFALEEADALAYAVASAEAFGVGGDWGETKFDPKLVSDAVVASKAKAEKGKKSKG